MTTSFESSPPMLRDIARQPDVLRGLGRRAAEFAALGREVLSPGPRGRVFVAGCGDGVFAAEAAAHRATELGLDWRAIGSLDLVLSASRLRPDDRVVCISMSGNVDRTVEAARAVTAAGVPLLGLVNGSGGRLGEIATRKVSLDLSDMAPFLCGTASYTATVFALMLLAAGAAGSSEPIDAAPLADAQAAAEIAASAVLPGLGAPVPTGIRILSAGADRGTARYGAAKFVELTRIPVWSADLEEFAHSQYWAMPVTDMVIVVAADPVLADYADASCAALTRLGVSTLAIDTEATPVASATHHITLPAVPVPLGPLVTPVPLQLVAYRLAEASGLDPNSRLHLKADTTRFTVSRMLTRRSLIGTGQ
jgi:fructoselysine-6-P-deglycase FrlB-like protein